LATSSHGQARSHLGEIARFLEQMLVVDGERHVHQLPHQGDDVGLCERADFEVGVQAQPRVQLVPAYPGEVVPLGIEADVPEQVAAGLQRGRLARALLLEQFDQGFLHRADGVFLQRRA
jgi:hypothetical protein